MCSTSAAALRSHSSWPSLVLKSDQLWPRTRRRMSDSSDGKQMAHSLRAAAQASLSIANTSCTARFVKVYTCTRVSAVMEKRVRSCELSSPSWLNSSPVSSVHTSTLCERELCATRPRPSSVCASASMSRTSDAGSRMRRSTRTMPMLSRCTVVGSTPCDTTSSPGANVSRLAPRASCCTTSRGQFLKYGVVASSSEQCAASSAL
mmetsp:Transcript_20383/g.72084  ORF Transcript_20383/g.72084 Transcript_20383/m.72084 type:complete len:205 (+) Transcript_20383:409-1023(+)